MRQGLENVFVVLWMDDNGNGEFGKFPGTFTKEEAIEEVIKDIYQLDLNEDTEEDEVLEILEERNNKCENYKKQLQEDCELNIPGVISYKIDVL